MATRFRYRLGRRAAAALGAALALSGCSLLPGSGREQPRLYDLTPKSTFSTTYSRMKAQLLVDLPTASAGLTSSRIAIKQSPTTLDYFARSEWTDVAPKLVHTLMIESFDNTNALTGLEREGTGLRTDFLLKTDLREFQAELYKGRQPVVRVRIQANLVRWTDREIIANGKFEATVPIENQKIDAIVVGFDDALGKVLKHLVEWTLQRIKADIRRKPIQRY